MGLGLADPNPDPDPKPNPDPNPNLTLTLTLTLALSPHPHPNPNPNDGLQMNSGEKEVHYFSWDENFRKAPLVYQQRFDGSGDRLGVCSDEGKTRGEVRQSSNAAIYWQQTEKEVDHS